MISRSVEETMELGRRKAAELKSGDVISLSGPLGAGKTCLIKGIAAGLGINAGDVRSPSFTLVNELYGKMPLYHFDLYRMKNISELYEIGWDDYLMREGITVVEWGEKAGDMMPRDSIKIEIKIVSEKRRKIFISYFNKPAG
ncbi:MAG: tRNA (adenosine(37)-N6)-threonylcarbamoyltransferase complex ATPase subunit type 1 TsaE [candidate division Zixibacteria bacterium HGW-Zixibacteria-1]|nr:MAG: tRNA (adenosine(37)-N6)-threonylcarbamoyltransferase complex ATPase subunit type 1 TsaE [candidate division Zixibacteria bacterium HGW-Zixibacteria-1]